MNDCSILCVDKLMGSGSIERWIDDSTVFLYIDVSSAVLLGCYGTKVLNVLPLRNHSIVYFT